VFASRLFVINGLTTEENAIRYFIKTIPFNFYAWAALLVVFLLIIRVIPPIGRMKKADNRVKNGGPIAPEGSEKIDIRGKDNDKKAEGKMIDFILPILCLLLSTILSGVDMQKGVIITLAFMYLLYVGRGVLTAAEFADYFIEGIKNMLLPLILMVLAFLFSHASDKIHFTETIIDSLLPVMSKIPQLMPLFVFIILGLTEFITGTNWGLYIIALPIVIPLAQALGVNTPLAIAAVLSAGVFGSHICFYSDATIISSAACGCDNFEHGLSQMPYGFIGAGIAMILFTVFGFVMM
jgi:Na+/H+ antiporter NhaC